VRAALIDELRYFSFFAYRRFFSLFRHIFAAADYFITLRRHDAMLLIIFSLSLMLFCRHFFLFCRLMPPHASHFMPAPPLFAMIAL